MVFSRAVFADQNGNDATDPADSAFLAVQEKDVADRPFTIGGILDARCRVADLEKESPLFTENQSAFFRKSTASLSSFLEFYLNGDYIGDHYGLHVKTYGSYAGDGTEDFNIFEAYNYATIGSGFTIEFGKRIIGWGKGYLANPVGYFNPKKDVERPELPQEGILSMNAELTRSFNSNILKTAAFTFVAAPPESVINGNYGKLESTRLGAKLYALVFDIDVDIAAHFLDRRHYEYGFDFSGNIGDHIEIRGECNWFHNKTVPISDFGGFPSVPKSEGFGALAGIRFVPRYNTVLIAEYIHDDAGMSKTDFDRFLLAASKYRTLGSRAAQSPGSPFQARESMPLLMKDYLYAKATINDFLGILYLSMAPSLLLNLTDKSVSGGPGISYTPFSNFETLVRPMAFIGDNYSEFGGRQFKAMVDFEMKVYF
jgi:hypothetical protein